LIARVASVWTGLGWLTHEAVAVGVTAAIAASTGRHLVVLVRVSVVRLLIAARAWAYWKLSVDGAKE